MMKPSISSLALVLLTSGCATDLVAGALSEVNLIDDDTTSTGNNSSGSTWGGPVSTVTSATTSASSSRGDAGDTDGATSGIDATTSSDADAPPIISKHELAPNPIQFAGPIEVKIWINGDADGVRMALDGADVELTLDPDTQSFFRGEIPAYSGLLQNSDEYVARFTPWRDDDGDLVEGDALEVPYAIQLHDSGEEDLWALDKSGGSGHVTAIGVLPEGDVVALQTLVQGKMSACSLRRRDPEGNSGPDDLVVVLPDRCRGLSLEVGDDGATYILIEADTNLGWMWAVARMAHFGAPLKWIADGEVGEVARDLAVSPSGGGAVCGSTPTPEPGDLEDSVVHIVRPDFSRHAKAFDHKNGNLKHTMDERANGCTFIDDDRVILVGEVFGKHDWDNFNDQTKRNRRFDVIYDLEADAGDLRVASAGGLARQSFATDVAVDHDEGRIYIVGHVCGNDVCDQVEAKMWTLDSEGDLASTTSLGLHSNQALAPSRVRVSPVAGYIVVASGGLAGAEGAFLVRAYAPFKAEPLWSYHRHDADLVHLPNALAIGPYGQAYAGGFGANGFPLFVIIYG